MIRGLMWYGMGRGGVLILEIMRLNLGGFLDRILKKYRSGYIMESGIINFLFRIFYDFVLKFDFVIIDSQIVKVFSVYVENDGIILKLSLQFDIIFKKVVGLVFGNFDINYVKVYKDLFFELISYLKDNIVIEVIVIVFINLFKILILVVGVGYYSWIGKMGENVIMNFI